MKRVALLGAKSWCDTLEKDLNSSGTLIVCQSGENLDKINPEEVDVVYINSNFSNCWGVAEKLAKSGIPVQVIPEKSTPTHYVKDEKLIKRLVATGLIREQTGLEDKDGEFLTGKKILVTGAGGSIGSDLCRKLIRWKPAHITMVDNSENGIYAVDLEITMDGFLDKTPIVADIRNRHRVASIIQNAKPDIVFHIAARKHVPLMEMYPEEAVSTNISGTIAVLEEADKAGVELFTFISTDKAADPANIMGVTKRISERVIQKFTKTEMKRCIVRFENVLDSDGNVVYTFLRQLRRGGNLTVTSPKMDRYFITRDHASQFIIRASSLAKLGEVFVPDAGPPINISKLATTIGSVMGYCEGKDFKIIYTKPRPGEKFSEELVTADEKKRQKKLDGIFIVPPENKHPADFEKNLELLFDATRQVNREKIRSLVAKLEPTYNP